MVGRVGQRPPATAKGCRQVLGDDPVQVGIRTPNPADKSTPANSRRRFPARTLLVLIIAEYEQTTSNILCSSHSFIAVAWETPTVGRPTRNGLFGTAAGSRQRRRCSWLTSSSS